MDAPIETIEVRTEVTGLKLEIRRYEQHCPMIMLRFNDEVVFAYPVIWEFERLKELFQMKNEPGQNFFDHVQSLVAQSTMRGVRTT